MRWRHRAIATPAAQRAGDNPRAMLDRAIEDFLAGRLNESVAGFDRVVALAPQAAPELWQRGIALYYAGRYQDCRAQFESHRTVNPNDVENPAWHFMCVAKAESPAKARAALLPVGPDHRSPMREIYEMFRGTMKPEAMLAAGGDQPSARFFAELYVGLYYDAIGDRPRAATPAQRRRQELRARRRLHASGRGTASAASDPAGIPRHDADSSLVRVPSLPASRRAAIPPCARSGNGCP